MTDGPATDDDAAVDDSPDTPRGFPAVGELDYIGALVRRALLIAVVVIAISFVAPGLITDLLRVLSDADRIGTIRPQWFVLMVAMEILSFMCIWWLTRIVLPKVSWFVAGTSQLTANSVSRIVPGGAAVGGATLYRMLAVSGVNPPQNPKTPINYKLLEKNIILNLHVWRVLNVGFLLQASFHPEGCLADCQVHSFPHHSNIPSRFLSHC